MFNRRSVWMAVVVVAGATAALNVAAAQREGRGQSAPATPQTAGPPPAGSATATPRESPVRRPVSAENAPVFAEFKSRLDGYVAVHKKAEGSLKPLPTEATPQQIDANQRDLGALIAKLRPTAKQGEIFTPAMQALVKRLLVRVFSGPDGKLLRASVMDENPVGTKVAINSRYPDEIPLSTMPPEVLQELPELPEELEYRFVGASLALVDVHAHIIADYVPGALPGA